MFKFTRFCRVFTPQQPIWKARFSHTVVSLIVSFDVEMLTLAESLGTHLHDPLAEQRMREQAMETSRDGGIHPQGHGGTVQCGPCRRRVSTPAFLDRVSVLIASSKGPHKSLLDPRNHATVVAFDASGDDIRGRIHVPVPEALKGQRQDWEAYCKQTTSPTDEN